MLCSRSHLRHVQLAKYLKTAGCVTCGTDSHNYIVERSVADLTMTTERDDGVESALCRTRSHRCHMPFVQLNPHPISF